MVIAVALLVLGLTILAFVLKNAILHMVCVPSWLVLGVLMWNQPWPASNTFLATAFAFLAILMAIVHLVMAVNHYLGQRTTPPTHDEVQGGFRKQIYDMTHRERDESWP